MGRTRVARWRAAVLIAVNVLMIAHLIQWAIMGMTVSPIEPSESMETLEIGVVNAGAIFFLVAILSTILLGRFFCGWLCHIVALQDLCAWIMTKLGVRPKPFRSRLLVYFPFALGMYMFVWPSFKRSILAPALESMSVDWPAWLRPVEPIHQWSSALIVDDFWATMPPWYVAVPFLAICGFACVYFLGAKGFCTYGCPYAAFFKPLDTIAPVRVRVNDNCHQCGHCTSVCTSNVRVSEEVRDFGMVVDPGCMKTLDCISTCPNDALSLGLGKPALGAKARSPETYKKAKAKRRRRYDMALWEEILAALLLLWFFFATRGVFDAVPMLLAGGLAAIGAMVVIMAIKLAHEANVRLYGFRFKLGGRLRAPGYLLIVLAMAFIGASLWSGQARYLRWRGDVLYAGAQIPTSVLLRPEFNASGAQRRDARHAIEAYSRADSFENGGVGWSLNAEHRLRLSYFLSVVGEHGKAAAQLERVIESGNPTDALVLQAGQLLTRSIDDNPPAGVEEGQLANLKRERLLAMYERALAAHPGLHAIRVELSRSAYSVGELAKAEAYWEGPGAFEDDPMYSMSHAGYVGFTGDAPKAEALFAQAAQQAQSLDRPAGVLIDIGRTALGFGLRETALEMAQRAIDDKSATALTWLAAGEIANAVGQPDLGTTRGERALTMKGVDSPMVQARAAGVILKPGSLDRGRELLIDAAERADDPFEVLYIARGMIYAGSSLNDPELLNKGIGFIGEAVDAHPDLYVIAHDYASVLYSVGRNAEAIEQMVRAAEADSGNALLASRAADLYGMQGDEQQAQRWREESERRAAP